MKQILLFVAIALSTFSFGQNVPSYVPTNGLVGWWPFDGNANDESGNGNNGTVNGASLTTDRNGNTNRAYSFDVSKWEANRSNADNVYIPYNSMFNFSEFTISTWVNRASVGALSSPQTLSIIRRFEQGYNNPNGETWTLDIEHGNNSNGSILKGGVIEQSPSPATYFMCSTTEIVPLNEWIQITMTYSQNTIRLYFDGILVCNTTDNSISINTEGSSGISIGLSIQGNGNWSPFDGKIDDVGIWNRALTQQEISSLYNECNSSISSQPIDQIKNISNNAQFIVTSTDLTSTYQWQTDLGVGFQNLNSVGQYNGTTNDTLNVLNVTMNNNNQPFRCIISSGSCSDTSNIAVLTVNNTVGIDENKIDQPLIIYPNPTQNQINIKGTSDFIGSTYIIFDNVGKTVLTGHINSENTIIELNNLNEGIYLLNIDESLNQKFTIIKK